MKKITLLIPDDYSNVLTATMVGVKFKDSQVPLTNIKTGSLDITEHNGDTYKFNEGNGGHWLYSKKDGYCTNEYTCPECPHLDNDYDDVEVPCRAFIKE